MVWGGEKMILIIIIGVLALFGILILRSHKMLARISFIHALIALVYVFSLFFKGTLPGAPAIPTYFFVDSLNIFESLLACFIFLLAAIYSQGYITSLITAGEMTKKNLTLFYAAFNLLLTTILLAFFSNNLALFWIFTELTTLFSAVLIVTLNAKENITAALNYVFIVSTAMLFSFLGLILLFAASKATKIGGTLSWDLLMKNAASLPPSTLGFAFLFLFIGFAAKSGIAPFHTWLPHAHAKAPSVISALLSAILLNIGIYGIIRIFAIIQLTSAAHLAKTILFVFGFITIAIAGISMYAQKNLKKLIAFSSTENMGFLLIGIAIGTPLAFFFVLLHILGHTLAKALLFFSAGILHRQYDSVEIRDFTDLLTLQPLAALGILIGTLTVIGMPLFPIFISKLFLLIELGKISPVLLVILALLLFIVTVSFSTVLIRMFSQTRTTPLRHLFIPTSMRTPIIILIIALFALGIVIPDHIHTLFTTIISELGM
jgi:hydrogenase-4 component F